MLKRIFLCGAVLFAFSLVNFADQGEEEEVVLAEEAATTTVQAEEKKEAEEAEEVKAEEAKEEEKTEESAKETVDEGGKAEEVVAEPAVEPAKQEEEFKAQKEKQEEAPAPVPVMETKPSIQEAQEAKKEEPTEMKKEKHEDTHLVRYILMWLPNRLIDLSDVISADIGAGSEFALECGITKFFSFGGANGEKYFLMKGYERQMGGGYDSGWNYQTAFLNSEKRYIEDTFGSVKKYYKTRKPYGMLDHRNFVYSEHIRDIWAVEARVGWLAVVGIQLHPTELADFIAGIFFIDIKKDDLK